MHGKEETKKRAVRSGREKKRFIVSRLNPSLSLHILTATKLLPAFACMCQTHLQLHC